MLQSTLRSGELDREISFIKPDVTIGAANSDYVGSWSPIASNPTVRARKEEMPGREMEIAGRLTYVQKTKFTIRYRTDILQTYRVVCEGRVYQIISVTEPAATRKRTLDIVCNLLDNET